MATELGQAYVQIMPSAKGISGSIQKAINPEATSAGKSAGMNIATNISKSMGSLGKTLTKSITLPVAGAVAAIGGMVGAFGWGRLVGLDSARAQLQGLGYDAESVERISSSVNDAIQGTVTTMAEGVSVAAGGLAAGVKEGAELEKYIQLVGDAAVGANRPVEEMAQIFNRVQGSGKLMTMELNMIEQGMPGFAQAMADHLGVPQDEFRKMVTAGEISSKDFLTVMDDFAGDMSDAYAKSWKGMVSNTKAWIGIIGENILSGVFEQSKESIAEFMEFLKSDSVQDWAKQTGETIGEAFTSLIETVKDAITWWSELDGATKSLIGKIAGIAVVAGPILMTLSKIVGVVLRLAPLFKILGAAIGALTSPVGLVIAAIVGAAALIYVYWEPIKDFFINMWETIKETAIGVWDSIMNYLEPVIQSIVDFAMEIWGTFVDFWLEHGEMIKEAVTNVWTVIETVVTTVIDTIVMVIQWLADIVWEIMKFIWPFVEMLIIDTWNAIKNVISGAIDVILGIIQFFSALFTGNWRELWESIKQILSGVVQALWGLINLWFVGKILKLGKTFFNLFKGVFRSGWNVIKNIFTSSLGAVRNVVSTVFNAIRSVITSIMNGVRGTISNITGSIKSRFTSIFNALKGIVSGAFNGVKSAIKTGITGGLDIIKNMATKFFNAGKNIVTSIVDGIKGSIGNVGKAMGDLAGKARNFLPFSPPKEGPLRDIMDVKWGETISGGIVKGESVVAKAMDNLLDPKIKFSDNKATLHNNSNLLEATLEQNYLLSKILEKDNTAVVAFDPIYNETKKRMNRDKYSSAKQRRRR